MSDGDMDLDPYYTDMYATTTLYRGGPTAMKITRTTVVRICPAAQTAWATRS